MLHDMEFQVLTMAAMRHINLHLNQLAQVDSGHYHTLPTFLSCDFKSTIVGEC